MSRERFPDNQLAHPVFKQMFGFNVIKCHLHTELIVV